MQLISEPLFSVAFRHNYYQDNSCRFLKTVLAEETNSLMKRYGLIIKLHESGFRIYYESWFAGRERTYEEIKQFPLILKILLINTDIYFYNYTNGFTDHAVSDTVLCFRNNGDDGRLHTDVFAGSSSAASEVVELLPGNFRRPFGVIYFNLQEVQPIDYYIQFDAKKVYWRYVVATQHLRDLENPAIINKADQSVFDGPVSCELPDQRNALLFTSGSPLKVSEQSDRNFQLVESYNINSGRQKVVIQMLPNPNVKHISAINGGADKKDGVPYADVIL